MTATLSATYPALITSTNRRLPMALSGWARYPVEHCEVYRPERQADLFTFFRESRAVISRGLGRSFGDAALNQAGAVIVHTRLNRFLAFDPVQHTLRCEAGVSIGEILETFLPRGYCLAVSPGTRFVTIGGAIASDVHGKNHQSAGSFGNIVEEIEIATPTGRQSCSPTHNAALFWATVGGMGMTGAIIAATIKLRRVETAYMHCEYTRLPDLDATLNAFLSEPHDGREYAIAWIDCLAKGRNLGRSVLMRADHATAADLASSQAGHHPLAMRLRPVCSIPSSIPVGILNALTARVFNSFYYGSHRSGTRIIGFHEFLYAMDAVQNWNTTYGRRGFIEHQCVVPPQTAGTAVRELLEACDRAGRKPFLASIKAFGEADPGLLSFPMKGFTLVLDLPVDSAISEFVATLDEIVIRHGGRIYLAKDASLDKQRFRAMYPRWQELTSIKTAIDPELIISSSMTRRLGLAE